MFSIVTTRNWLGKHQLRITSVSFELNQILRWILIFFRSFFLFFISLLFSITVFLSFCFVKASLEPIRLCFCTRGIRLLEYLFKGWSPVWSIIDTDVDPEFIDLPKPRDWKRPETTLFSEQSAIIKLKTRMIRAHYLLSLNQQMNFISN